MTTELQMQTNRFVDLKVAILASIQDQFDNKMILEITRINDALADLIASTEPWEVRLEHLAYLFLAYEQLIKKDWVIEAALRTVMDAKRKEMGAGKS